MRETITRAEVASLELEGPISVQGEDRFRAQDRFEIRLSGPHDCPEPLLVSPDGRPLRVLAEDGSDLDPEEVQVLLWERLEQFDEVIERLAGPLPAP